MKRNNICAADEIYARIRRYLRNAIITQHESIVTTLSANADENTNEARASYISSEFLHFPKIVPLKASCIISVASVFFPVTVPYIIRERVICTLYFITRESALRMAVYPPVASP